MLEALGISKSFKKAGVSALSDISFTLGNSGLVAICGPAASGKTTLLNILGGIERPDEGELLVDGKKTSGFRQADWNGYRNGQVGFVFQDPILVEHRSVLENVALALEIAGVDKEKRADRSLDALRLMGIENCASMMPGDLSNAQRRLVAIARAMAQLPPVLLVDDSTCGLDAEAADRVMYALHRASKSHLVIAATGDEDFARRHADRIITLDAGTLVSDESASSSRAASSDENLESIAVGAAHASKLGVKAYRGMPFMAAIKYSLRSISAKKGRALLTAIAAAISMIGIAAIVALGGGVSNFIASLEEASIATEPIVVGKSGLDITGMLSSDTVNKSSSQGATVQQDTSDPNAAKINKTEQSIESISQMLAETVSHVRDNDLAGFKQYVDSNSDGILDYIDTVQYDYGVTPLVYTSDTSYGVEKLNPSDLTDMLMRRANTTASTLNDMGRFNEMIDDEKILNEQMDIVYGSWPKSYNECVIVLDENGAVSDYTLYCLGLYDHKVVEDAINKALSGEEINLPDTPNELSYDELMNASFTVLPRVSLYEKNESRGTWADKSRDDEYIAKKIAQDGITLKVSGIVQPKKDVLSPLMSEGVGYMHSLADHLIDISSQSEITKQQIANPEIDVFTGKSFEDLKAHPAGNLDLDNIITVNEKALGRLLGMFKDDGEGASNEDGSDLLDFDLSQIDWSQFEINERDVFDSVNMQKLYDAISLASILDPSKSGLKLTNEQQAKVNELSGEMIAHFTAYAVGKGATAEALRDSKQVEKYWKDYLKTDDGKKQMAAIDLLVGKSYGDVVSKQLEDYLTGVYAEVVIDEAAAEILEQASSAIARQITREVERKLPKAAEKLGAELEKAIASELDHILTEVGRGIDAAGNEIANIIQINMTEEDLVAYMNNLLDSSEIGYANNMAKLDYADMSTPLSMSIYPKNLAAKEKVIDIIGVYNERMEQAGQHDRTIIYNNSAGDTSKALSTVAGITGLALIALIGISLVVGSIMTAIVVLANTAGRQREMGLLRALGASRGNLAVMFNVETFVLGLIAGAIAVGLVFVISMIVNSAGAAATGGMSIMSLSPGVAFGLIGLSGLMPLLAGLIPSLVFSRGFSSKSLRS